MMQVSTSSIFNNKYTRDFEYDNYINTQICFQQNKNNRQFSKLQTFHPNNLIQSSLKYNHLEKEVSDSIMNKSMANTSSTTMVMVVVVYL